MENLRKGAVPKPGSSLRLSVVEAGRGIGSTRFITNVRKRAIDFFVVLRSSREGFMHRVRLYKQSALENTLSIDNFGINTAMGTFILALA